MTDLDTLEQDFASALERADDKVILQVLTSFDELCRFLIEQESDDIKKKQLIERCLTMQNDWQSKIIKLKAKVKGEMADIRSNGKKIKKYLTSY